MTINKALAVVIVVLLYIAFTVFLSFVYADNDKFNDCNWLSYEYDSCTRLDHVIKQNDWIICSELHKASHGFNASDNWGEFPEKKTAYRYDELIKICGEIP